MIQDGTSYQEDPFKKGNESLEILTHLYPEKGEIFQQNLISKSITETE